MDLTLHWAAQFICCVLITGTYNPNIGGRDSGSCIVCRAGESCTVRGLSEPDQPCSPGYYCPGGNFLPNQTEYACPPGTYNDYSNATKEADCAPCIERFACLVSYTLFSNHV